MKTFREIATEQVLEDMTVETLFDFLQGMPDEFFEDVIVAIQDLRKDHNMNFHHFGAKFIKGLYSSMQDNEYYRSLIDESETSLRNREPC